VTAHEGGAPTRHDLVVSVTAPTSARPARPKLRRAMGHKHVAGVAGGIARSIGIDPLIVRVAFVIVTIVSGLGVPIYLAGWALIPPDSGGSALASRLRTRPGSWQVASGVGCLSLGALLTVRELGLWWSDAIVWPFVLAVSGGALVWRHVTTRGDGPPETVAARTPRAGVPEAAAPAAEAEPDRGAELAQRLRTIYQGGFGVALVVGAALLFLQANGALSGARDLVLSFVVVALGLGLVLAPFWLRLVRGLTAERNERIRSQERAEVAAHLHDSVLQTLALVQKRADDPRAVATLARRQERELRTWLSGAPAARPDERLADALRAAAAEVEEAHGTPVEVVTVGDRDLDDRSRALVAAAREALANAVRHAGSDAPISLYAEVTDGHVEVFVRDRGCGFDPGDLPADRRGVRESIVGRMARHGGRAAVHSTPGQGTEVELVLDG
jgi:signal transduction histidine kinase/phage shock protein PspC (stress-responsive transcriptional regulator)